MDICRHVSVVVGARASSSANRRSSRLELLASTRGATIRSNFSLVEPHSTVFRGTVTTERRNLYAPFIYMRHFYMRHL
jgi:hypothetical protein